MRAHAAALLLLLPLAAGCVTPGSTLDPADLAGSPFPVDAAFDTSGEWSRTLVAGPHAMLDVESIFMPSFDGTKIHIGVFRPDVPEGTRVPVIVDAGPYYGDGDEGATSATTRRLGGFLIENFVPHGYAVAQVSIRGTGLSTGCVDYMGEKEQRDMDAVVTFLGEQEWSNGNVGMIGRSYDGSTPWEAAMFGNPHLKTIVPISGISDLQQLHFRNGTSEARSLLLGSLYYSYAATNAGLDGPEEDPMLIPRAVCTEGPQHTPMGAVGYATGGGRGVPGPVDAYWAERSFAARVLENYDGSIFYIHGLQDWNVKPSQGTDVFNAFEGKKKALLGQWAHNYPDRPGEHDHLRWDWAEMLLRWFDSELKGIPTDTGPGLEVEDHTGHWRAEAVAAWPPVDARWDVLRLTADGELVADAGQGDVDIISAAPLALTQNEAPLAPRVVTFVGEPLAAETLVSGMPRFHAMMSTSTPGGNVWAELWELPQSGDPVRFGRAQMDLRYAAGGITPQAWEINVPQPVFMEFHPLDARLAAGSSIALVVTGEPEDLDMLPNPMSARLTLHLEDEFTTLQLPVLDRPFVPSRWDVVDGEVRDETA